MRNRLNKVWFIHTVNYSPRSSEVELGKNFRTGCRHPPWAQWTVALRKGGEGGGITLGDRPEVTWGVRGRRTQKEVSEKASQGAKVI